LIAGRAALQSPFFLKRPECLAMRMGEPLL
jgi:hypothetical protein